MLKSLSTLIALAVCGLGSLAGVMSGQSISPTSPQPLQEKATVVIWKTWHVATIGRAAFDVFLDETPIAKLDRARYLIARVTPGRHVFRTKTREAGAVELDAVAGHIYYLRMDTTSGLAVGRPVLTQASEEEGRAAIKQSKPLNPDDIKDRSTIVMS